jgi:hypothetical protein
MELSGVTACSQRNVPHDVQRRNYATEANIRPQLAASTSNDFSMPFEHKRHRKVSWSLFASE